MFYTFLKPVLIKSVNSYQQGHVYLGGTDGDTWNTWKWMDGTPWAYENWGPGQPDNGQGTHWWQDEKYLEMYDTGKHGPWNDIGAHGEKLGFVCQY